MPSVATICSYLDRLAPLDLAASWDNVGLLFGNPSTEVQRLLTCLTITSAVASEAIEAGVQLIISHHPILFHGMKRFTTQTSEGRFLWQLARSGISVYSPHTAFDNCAGGINDIIARQIGLLDVRPLRPAAATQFKVVVFVPESDLKAVADAMFSAGAGQIGKYSECSYRVSGTGTFFGSDATNPTIGKKGQREEVAESRLETVCPADRLDLVVNAMRKAHSYEEPAFDVYPLQASARQIGEGRTGRLSQAITLSQLGALVKSRLSANTMHIVGSGSRMVERVAIVCGAGGDFLKDAVREKADVFITGEMRFHDYLSAEADGMSLVIAGHYASERHAVEDLAHRLQSDWPGLVITASSRDTNPVHVI